MVFPLDKLVGVLTLGTSAAIKQQRQGAALIAQNAAEKAAKEAEIQAQGDKEIRVDAAKQEKEFQLGNIPQYKFRIGEIAAPPKTDVYGAALLTDDPSGNVPAGLEFIVTGNDQLGTFLNSYPNAEFLGTRTNRSNAFKRKQIPLLQYENWPTNVVMGQEPPELLAQMKQAKIDGKPLKSRQIGTFNGYEEVLFEATKMKELYPKSQTSEYFMNGAVQPDLDTAIKSAQNYGPDARTMRLDYDVDFFGNKTLVGTTTGADAYKVAAIPEKEVVTFSLPTEEGGFKDYIKIPTGQVNNILRMNGFDNLNDIKHTILGETIVGGEKVYTVKSVNNPGKLKNYETYSVMYRGSELTFDSQEELNRFFDATGMDRNLVPVTTSKYKLKDGELEEHSSETSTPKTIKRPYTMRNGNIIIQYGGEDETTIGMAEILGDTILSTERDAAKDDAIIKFPDTKDGETSFITKLASDATEEEILKAEQNGTIIAGKTRKDTNGGTHFVPDGGGSSAQSTDDLLFNVKIEANGMPLQLGAKLKSNAPSTLIAIQGKLSDPVINHLNNNIEDRERYLSTAVPAIVNLATQSLGRDKDGRTLVGEYDNEFVDTVAILRKLGVRFFEIDGFEEKVLEIDGKSRASQVSNMERLITSEITIEDNRVVGPQILTVKVPGQNPVVIGGDAMNTSIDLPYTTGSDRNDTIVTQTVLPILTALHSGNEQEAKEQVVRNILSNTERRVASGPNGQKFLLLDAAPFQPSVNIIGALNAAITPDRQGTLYTQFIRMANRGYRVVNTEDTDLIANEIMRLPLNQGVRLIEAHIGPMTTKGTKSYAPEAVRKAATEKGLLGFENSQTIRARLDSATQVSATVRGITLEKKILDSFLLNERGQPTLSSSVVNAGYKIKGLDYLISEGFSEILTLGGALDFSGIGKKLKTRTKKALESVAEANNLTIAADNQYGAVDKQIDEMVAELEGANLTAGQEAKLAARQFHIVTLAYEIAAAIQGGTGGRTISDQDVALILSALRQGPLSSPQAQVDAIRAAGNMLRDINAHATYASSTDPVEQAAYALWTHFSVRSDVLPPQYNSIESVQSYLTTELGGEPEQEDLSNLSRSEIEQEIADTAAGFMMKDAGTVNFSDLSNDQKTAAINQLNTYRNPPLKVSEYTQ